MRRGGFVRLLRKTRLEEVRHELVCTPPSGVHCTCFFGLTCTVVGYSTSLKKPNSLAFCLISIGREEGIMLVPRH